MNAVNHNQQVLRHDTIIDVLRWRALNQPARHAYTFLSDGENEEESLSYAELERGARKVGSLLQSYTTAGDRVLLLYPSGLDFVVAFFGSLYAGLVPVAAPQPRPNKTLNRLRTIAADAGASVVLTTGPIISLTEKLFALVPQLQDLRWLATDSLDDGFTGELEAPRLKGDMLAFLQYTSGSTSAPKGVMITHENVMQNSADIDLLLRHGADTVFISWLPHFHDMGLISGVVLPMYTGFPAYLLSPMHFLQRPARWLDAFTRYRGTHSAAPSFAYDLCVRKVTPEQCARLDLSSWKVACNAAEPVSAQAMERFIQTFEPCGFRRKTFSPAYGLAEVTLITTAVPGDEEAALCTVQAAALANNKIVEVSGQDRNTRTLVSCGRATHATEVVIAGPESFKRRRDNEIGEIWVRGKSVAKGYWRCPENIEEIFRARLYDSGEGPFLRTGDLGFIRNGELYVTGRLKDLIIIAGSNHYPQDIEGTVDRSHPALRPNCCAAFSVEDNEQEALVVVAEVEPHYRPASGISEPAPGRLDKHPALDPAELSKVIRRAVAEEHELPIQSVNLIKAGTIPKTTSGKIRRGECKRLFLNNCLERWR